MRAASIPMGTRSPKPGCMNRRSREGIPRTGENRTGPGHFVATGKPEPEVPHCPRTSWPRPPARESAPKRSRTPSIPLQRVFTRPWQGNICASDENRPGYGIPYANDTIIRTGHSLGKKFPRPPAGVHRSQYQVGGRSGGKITVPPPDPQGL